MVLCIGLTGTKPTIAQPVSGDHLKRILVVFSNANTLTANRKVAAGISQALESDLSLMHELYYEFRAIEQFPEDDQDGPFVDMLVRKYSERPPDVVVAIGPKAFGLVKQHLADFAPDAAIIAGAITRSSLEGGLSHHIHAAVTKFDVVETVRLARRMQPNADRLVVFTGSSAFDREWQETALEQLGGDRRLKVDFVSDLSLEEFESTAAALDPNTILLILTIFEDAAGARYIPAEAADQIALRSSAPTWGVYSTYLEKGVTGGVVASFEKVGLTIGTLARDAMLDRLAPSTVVDEPQDAVLNWEELRRFKLDADLVPPGAVLLNYSPTVWQRYWTTIFTVAAVLLAQTVTIAALVVQGRWRQKAQREAAEQRLEVARLSRISQLGALSGAITHELNQPLTSILANADAGYRLLNKTPPDIDEVREILSDIAEDDRRAAKIISDLRSLMDGKQTQHEPLDLNEIARNIASLVKSEALIRGVRLALWNAPQPLIVSGDPEQIKQVVLNLAINGMDAMVNQPQTNRILSIETAQNDDGWYLIAVQDNGDGLSQEVAANPFRPFTSTKSNGLGMGLAICKTIAEAHRGTIGFEPCKKGARVVFALPPWKRK